MTRRRTQRRSRGSRFRGEGEEGIAQRVFAVVGGLVLVACAIGVSVYYFGIKQERDLIDKVSFCPKDGPKSVTSVLIDSTEGINDVQAEAIGNLIHVWAEEVPVNGALKIYEVSGSEGLEVPIVDVCNPGSEENASAWNQSLREVKANYLKRFKEPVEKLVTDLKKTEKADSSPIMEAIQEISVQDFGKGAKNRHLIVVSDLMQHTSEFSLYKNVPDIKSFRKTPYGRKVDAGLRDVMVDLFIVRSPAKQQTDDVGQFWLDWFYLQGADIQEPKKVPG